jgi:hypothetical protein
MEVVKNLHLFRLSDKDVYIELSSEVFNTFLSIKPFMLWCMAFNLEPLDKFFNCISPRFNLQEVVPGLIHHQDGDIDADISLNFVC